MYRAAKRGEAWATKIIETLKKSPLTGLLMFVYRNFDLAEIAAARNPFLSMIPPTDDAWSGKYIPLPYDYETKK